MARAVTCHVCAAEDGLPAIYGSTTHDSVIQVRLSAAQCAWKANAQPQASALIEAGKQVINLAARFQDP